MKSPVAPQPPSEIDWPSARDETVRHLQRLIQFDTTNPPGNELPLARYLDTVLSAEGIETRLFQPAPERGAVIARIRGRGTRQPVLLVAHMDVVGVEREHWSVDPFGGVVKDGYVYGRGAIDDKGMLAANLMTMLLLQRSVVLSGTPLARDVVFVASADEETGGELGMQWLLENHSDLLQAEFALNEGGRIRIVEGRPLYVAVQTCEKVSHVVTVTARGPSGHASVPLEDNAIGRLGRALAAIAGHSEPVTVLPATRRFFGTLATLWPNASEGAAMADIGSGDPERAERGARALNHIPVFNAVLRSGISPTIVSGGAYANVIPAEAQAVLNVRTLPGDSVDAIGVRLANLIDEPNVEVAVTGRGLDAPMSSFDSPMFEAIAETVRVLNPAMVTVPYLSTGATDSARLRRSGVQAYGVLPFPLEPEDEGRMHGHDERIPLSSLEFGTRLIFGSVCRVAL